MFSFPLERLLFEPYENNMIVKSNNLDVCNPRTDFIESDKDFKINMELPGIEKTDIDIDLSPKNLLTICAERKVEEKKEGDKWHINERSYTKFSRSFKLPRDIDHDSIKAGFDKGVLSITVNKMAQPEPETKKILIQ